MRISDWSSDVCSSDLLPLGLARGQLVVRQLDVQGPLLGVDDDDVALLQQADRAAERPLRPDVADAEAARGAGQIGRASSRERVGKEVLVEEDARPITQKKHRKDA